MPADDSLLFIDTNKYLDLYRTKYGKKLLPTLGQLIDDIFITQQIVDEVFRNKLSETVAFLGKCDIPRADDFYHPLWEGMGDAKEIEDKCRQWQSALKKVQDDAIDKVSRSEDDVSVALEPLFAKARSATGGEMQKARDRKERGNPPGKKKDAIGDELNWEQLLAAFRGKRGRKRLWIISRDGDYTVEYKGRFILNCFLFEELRSARVEVFAFKDTMTAIEHFIKETGVTGSKLPVKKDAQKIKDEENRLMITSAVERAAAERIDRELQRVEDTIGILEADLNNAGTLNEDMQKVLNQTQSRIADMQTFLYDKYRSHRLPWGQWTDKVSALSERIDLIRYELQPE